MKLQTYSYAKNNYSVEPNVRQNFTRDLCMLIHVKVQLLLIMQQLGLTEATYLRGRTSATVATFVTL